MNWYVPQNLDKEFIAGFTFNKYCDQSVCPRYDQRFDPVRLNKDSILFLNLDYFEAFVDVLRKSNLNSKFVLLTHNSDRDFSQNMLDTINPFVNKVYAVNCSAKSEKIVKLPLGFNDQSTEILDKMNFKFTTKENLVYVNFKLHHHPERPKCLEYFKKQQWATIEPELLPQSEYYNKAINFKYSICPRGTGIDTHRIYESLLFGVIPIVKTTELDDLYEKFPIIIVKNWEEITDEFLESNYDRFLSNYLEWKKNNENWFNPKYWLN